MVTTTSKHCMAVSCVVVVGYLVVLCGSDISLKQKKKDTQYNYNNV